jgi:hypothetical protein
MKAHHDVNGLIKALEYKKDLGVCRDVAYALDEFGDLRTPSAVECWKKRRDPQPRMNVEA